MPILHDAAARLRGAPRRDHLRPRGLRLPRFQCCRRAARLMVNRRPLLRDRRSSGWTRLSNRRTKPFSRLSYSRAPTRGGPAHPDEQEALGRAFDREASNSNSRMGDTMPARPPPAR